jgi:hypothetical protein
VYNMSGEILHVFKLDLSHKNADIRIYAHQMDPGGFRYNTKSMLVSIKGTITANFLVYDIMVLQ